MRSLGPWASATMARTAARTSFTVAGPSRRPPRIVIVIRVCTVRGAQRGYGEVTERRPGRDRPNPAFRLETGIPADHVVVGHHHHHHQTCPEKKKRA